MYKEIINNICGNIHTGVVDFDEPRSEASMPTQASSEFITNKQQGDWAEDVLFRAINENSDNIVAVRYGKSDDLVAGDAGFEEFFNNFRRNWTLSESVQTCCFSAARIMTKVWVRISATGIAAR